MCAIARIEYDSHVQRLTGLVLASFIILASPAAAEAPVFKVGTFSGKTSAGDAVKIRVYKGTCRKAFLNAIKLKGSCFDVRSFPVLTSECPGGESIKSESFTSGFGEINVLLKPNGKHSSELVTSSNNYTSARRTFVLTAKGGKITGTATWQETSPKILRSPNSKAEDALDCAKARVTFTAKR